MIVTKRGQNATGIKAPPSHFTRLGVRSGERNVATVVIAMEKASEPPAR